MPLKIALKSGERIVIGGAVICNGSPNKCELIIENNAPVLRQKDVLREKDAESPCSRLYFIIQLMYIDQENLDIHYETYWKIVKQVLNAIPSITGRIDQISEHIVNGKYYQALKLAGNLIDYEQEVIRHVR
jgi:flagellar biosynthesis repressor protein FlbT